MKLQLIDMEDMIEEGLIKLGRGKVISKRDIASCPGKYPIYSSARLNDGKFGEYGKYMFDQELITWSVDGGGKFFYRPKHKFSVTNVAGTLEILKPDKIHYKYLYYVLSDKHSRLLFDWSKKAHPSVIRRLYKNLPIPLLDDQIRIATLLSRVEALIATRKNNLQQLDDFLKSTFLDMFGDPVRNEKGWDVEPFNKIGAFTSGGTPSKKREDYWSGNFPWVSPKDMKTSYLYDSQDHISELVFDETTLKKIPAGSVLIVVRGMILAHSFPVAVNGVDVAINQDMKAIRPSESFDSEYLMVCIGAMRRKILKQITSAGHGTRKFDSDAMKKLLVPKPGIELQEKFRVVAKRIKKLKENYEYSLKTLENLYGSLSQKAFKGELDLSRVPLPEKSESKVIERTIRHI